MELHNCPGRKVAKGLGGTYTGEEKETKEEEQRKLEELMYDEWRKVLTGLRSHTYSTVRVCIS